MKNKVVIITGASSGIGKALAEECARKGALTVLSARNFEAISEISNSLNQKNYSTVAFQADVSIEEDCKNLIDFCIKTYGKIDVMINNAGISMRAVFSELDLDVIRKVMDVNFWGAIYCTHYALPHLLKSGGSVVGISSIAGNKGLPARTGYSASKFALQGFLEVLRIENLKTNLHVLIVCPGFTASNIRKTALSKDGSMQGESPRDEDKMMTSETVAKEIIQAIHKRKRLLLLTPQGKFIVWMNKFFPALMDKIIYNHMLKEPNSPLIK